jgi:hypothetical protein
MGTGYSTKIFLVLNTNNELRKQGDYRTQHLVLEA